MSGRARGAAARRVVVLTGAGISAESGLATFRGTDGLWGGERPEDVATPEAWGRDPARVWRFYQERRRALPGVAPNAAHRALASFEQELERAGGRFLLVTQNVDDLHERAGSRRLLHLHGELVRLACEACGQSVVDREHTDPAAFVACGTCVHPRLRPDVVWFGEVPLHLDEVFEEVRRASAFVAIGTSGVVWPAAGLLALARDAGARTLVNALERPENLEHEDEFVPGPATRVVPALLASLAPG